MSLRDELVQVLLERNEVGQSQRFEIIKTWHEYMAKFSLLLNPTLVNVMFLRSAEKHRTDFPWLPLLDRKQSRSEMLELLEESFSSQSPFQIDCATRALLSTHIDMLFEMIGETLTVKFVCSLAAQRPARG